MATSEAKTSGPHLPQEAEDCVNDSRKHHRSNSHATPRHTTYTRSSGYAELPDVLLRRMITHLGSAAVDSLTLLASVCRGWRDAVHNNDAWWRDALPEALPFLRTTDEGDQAALGATEMQTASAVVKAIVSRVGGYRQLWVKYMKAFHAPLQLPGSISRPTRIRSSVLNSEFYMIFNIYDRMKDCFLMSVAGRGVVPLKPPPVPWEETFGHKCYAYPRLQVYHLVKLRNQLASGCPHSDVSAVICLRAYLYVLLGRLYAACRLRPPALQHLCPADALGV